MKKMRQSRFFEMNDEDFLDLKRNLFWSKFKTKCFLCGEEMSGRSLSILGSCVRNCFRCNLKIDPSPDDKKGVFIWKFSDFGTDGIEETKLSNEDIKRLRKTKVFR